MNWTLSPEAKGTLRWYTHSISLVSLCIGALTLLLILRVTPPAGRVYMKYQNFLQFWTIVADIVLGFVLTPIPLLPFPGFLSMGLFSFLFSAHQSMVVAFFVLSHVVVAVLFCFLFRHQSVAEGGLWRLSKFSYWSVHVLLFVVFSVPSFVAATSGIMKSDEIKYINEKHSSMEWIIFSRVQFAVYDLSKAPSNRLSLAVSFLVANCIGVLLVLPVVAWHIFRMASEEIASMSTRTKEYHRTLTTKLLMESSVLVVFLILPIIVFAISSWTGSPSNEWCLVCGGLLVSHSFFHSLVLILTTPSFVRALSQPPPRPRTHSNSSTHREFIRLSRIGSSDSSDV